VRATGLLVPGAPVVVMLSGGRDSVCLLDVAMRLGAEVVALHVNYRLREDADSDEAACVALCERVGAALRVERPARETGNLQAWARDVRHRAAARLGDRIATGHTASDQVEGLLYRLAASPGRRALLGMGERDGPLIRPLLRVTREETAAHCRARGLQWREDPTNATDAYARNRVRHGLLEALREVHPAAEANLLRTLELLREEGAVLDAAVDAALTPDLEELRALLPALRRLIVQRLADEAHPRAPALAARTEEILALDEGSIDLGRGLRSVARRGRVGFAAPVPVRHPDIAEILVQADDLQHRIRELGAEISRDYAERDLLLVCVLKGAVFFLSDLMRQIDVPCEVDFMAVASYGSSTDSSGVVRILKDLDAAIEGRDVLIVEDIVDSGLTLNYLLRNLRARGPASLEVCALLTKPERRQVELPARYVGFEIPNRFAIGYGLDHAERFRNLPYVAALAEPAEP